MELCVKGLGRSMKGCGAMCKALPCLQTCVVTRPQDDTQLCCSGAARLLQIVSTWPEKRFHNRYFQNPKLSSPS